jgi:apolipoprotein N-acyltransferase
MVSRPSNNFLIALCLTLSAVWFFLGTGLSPLWALTWLAPIPVLWVAPRVSGGEAFFIAVAAFALGGLNEWSYSRSVLPTWLVASILLFISCVFAFAVLLFRGRIRRGQVWQAALIVPLFWVAVEYIIAITSVHGTFGDICYSQMNFLPILQIASVTGAGASASVFFSSRLRLQRF